MARMRMESDIAELRSVPFAGSTREPANRHIQNIQKAAAITRSFLPRAISPFEVMDILYTAHIHFVLVGTYALGGWMRKPRATDEIDILSPIRHHQKAVNTLSTAYGNCEVARSVNVTVLHDPQASSGKINLIRPNQPLFRAALKNTCSVQALGYRFNIPTLEMAITMKWVLMRAPDEGYAERYLHAHDFLQMIAANPQIDLESMSQICESVCPNKGEQMVGEVRRVHTGHKLKL